MKKYAQLIENLRAKNLTDIKIKEAILEKSKKEIQHFNFWFKGFKVKADEGAEAGKTIEIEGYASTNDIDRYGDIVNPSSFDDTIENFMKNPVMLLQHDHNKRIGDFTELSIDDKGLYVKWDVKYTAGDTELFEKIENKSLKGFSIWFRVLEAEFQDITDEKGNVVDWVFVIKKLDLIEISVVNVPANPFTLMKSIEDLAKKSFEAVVKDAEEEIEDKEEDLADDNENANDSQDDNANDNNEEITDDEKALNVEIDKDGEAEDPAPEEEEEKADETEEEAEAEEEGEKEEEEEKELDDEEEKNNIDNEEDVDVENPEEDTDGNEPGDDSKAFTTKMIEKIVDAKTGGNKKEFKSLVEKEVKNLSEKLTKDFKKDLDAVKSDLEKEIDAVVKLLTDVKDTEEELIKRIKTTVKGKGFLNFQSTKEKEQKSTRLEKILAGVKKEF